MMTREEMMDTIIRMYGFEAITTINFCYLAEDKTASDTLVEYMFIKLTG